MSNRVSDREREREGGDIKGEKRKEGACELHKVCWELIQMNRESSTLQNRSFTPTNLLSHKPSKLDEQLVLSTAEELSSNSSVETELADQLKLTIICSARTLDAVKRTCQVRWYIGTTGKRAKERERERNRQTDRDCQGTPCYQYDLRCYYSNIFVLFLYFYSSRVLIYQGWEHTQPSGSKNQTNKF